jgi:uncharacterized membrane protein (UPF0127 family)
MYTHRLSKKEKKWGLYFLGILALCIFLSYGHTCVSTKVCGSKSLETTVRNSVHITFPSGSIDAEVADTPASREKGLSGRSGLGKDEGMLFVFELPGRYGFWMKDMQFPIDMIWVNENGIVVNIVENAKPEDYPATYINKAPASYVIEIGANKARDYGIYLGTKVVISK